MVAAGTPVAAAAFDRWLRLLPRFALRLRRIPQPALREPLHRDILIGMLQLRERRQELFPIASAARGRLAVDEDRPVREARGHLCIVTGIRDSGFGIRDLTEGLRYS